MRDDQGNVMYHFLTSSHIKKDGMRTDTALNIKDNHIHKDYANSLGIKSTSYTDSYIRIVNSNSSFKFEKLGGVKEILLAHDQDDISHLMSIETNSIYTNIDNLPSQKITSKYDPFYTDALVISFIARLIELPYQGIHEYVQNKNIYKHTTFDQLLDKNYFNFDPNRESDIARVSNILKSRKYLDYISHVKKTHPYSGVFYGTVEKYFEERNRLGLAKYVEVEEYLGDSKLEATGGL